MEESRGREDERWWHAKILPCASSSYARRLSLCVCRMLVSLRLFARCVTRRILGVRINLSFETASDGSEPKGIFPVDLGIKGKNGRVYLEFEDRAVDLCVESAVIFFIAKIMHGTVVQALNKSVSNLKSD